MVVKSARKSSTSKSTRSRISKKVIKEPPKEFKVSEHVYVSKHEVLSSAEADELLRRYHSSPEQFPYILSSDPVLKELTAKPGDVVKISRRSGTAGQSTYYRVVVEG